ncbi:hypothetical protein NA57DRAFT_59576 [Rhizodiscina lignyota]|uniref:C2H2-type domain-containing protein n=1 Tax=Rhizodiscina lignyota TaxID=1504668 RepID=A0A9P4I9F6_9PEZI|nr:hypothetical protein NA57DRAFT_59576 [Rhizodiscina lignyota]
MDFISTQKSRQPRPSPDVFTLIREPQPPIRERQQSSKAVVSSETEQPKPIMLHETKKDLSLLGAVDESHGKAIERPASTAVTLAELPLVASLRESLSPADFERVFTLLKGTQFGRPGFLSPHLRRSSERPTSLRSTTSRDSGYSTATAHSADTGIDVPAFGRVSIKDDRSLGEVSQTRAQKRLPAIPSDMIPSRRKVANRAMYTDHPVTYGISARTSGHTKTLKSLKHPSPTPDEYYQGLPHKQQFPPLLNDPQSNGYSTNELDMKRPTVQRPRVSPPDNKYFNDSSANPRKVQKYVCTICDTKFIRKSDWKQHEERLHERFSYWRCPDCNVDRLLSRNQFKQHHKQHHKQVHNYNFCPHADAAEIHLRKRTAWGCGFCAALLLDWEERCQHVAQHYEEGKSKEDWRHTNVIWALLHQPGIHLTWRKFLIREYGARPNPKPVFRWDRALSGRSHSLSEPWNHPTRLQDLLEYGDHPQRDIDAVVQKAHDLGASHFKAKDSKTSESGSAPNSALEDYQGQRSPGESVSREEILNMRTPVTEASSKDLEVGSSFQSLNPERNASPSFSESTAYSSGESTADDELDSPSTLSREQRKFELADSLMKYFFVWLNPRTEASPEDGGDRCTNDCAASASHTSLAGVVSSSNNVSCESWSKRHRQNRSENNEDESDGDTDKRKNKRPKGHDEENQTVKEHAS